MGSFKNLTVVTNPLPRKIHRLSKFCKRLQELMRKPQANLACLSYSLFLLTLGLMAHSSGLRNRAERDETEVSLNTHIL